MTDDSATRKRKASTTDLPNANAEKKARVQAPSDPKASAEAEESEAVKLRVEKIMNSFKDSSETIISKVVPAKILKLTELYQEFSKGKPEELKLTEKGAPANKGILVLLDPLRKEVKELVEHCGILEMWVQLNIPRIQDQKAIGVSVKEEVADMLSSGKQAGLTVLESITKYFITRGKLVTQILKWPQAEDYRKAVEDLDEKTFHNLCSMTCDLRNNWMIMYDTIRKNHDRIKAVETSAPSTLWY